MFVGEQPGDQEDRAGQPFVGPAGKLLDEAMQQAGIARDEAYVTNAVKHFKFEPRGNRRIHAKPGAREIAACRPWLEAEIAAVKPKMIVCLGATAAQSLLGKDFRLTQHRGEVLKSDWAPWVLATTAPLGPAPHPGPRGQGRRLRRVRGGFEEGRRTGEAGAGLTRTNVLRQHLTPNAECRTP